MSLRRPAQILQISVKSFLFSSLALYIVFFLAVSPAFASTTIDNFNSYTTGNLNTQGGWSGSTCFQVETTVVEEGANAINCGTGVVSISKSITLPSQTDGTIIATYQRNSDTSSANIIDLMKGANIEYRIQLQSDGTAYIGGVTDVALLVGYSANTWYLIETYIDYTNDQAKARINGGAWSTFVADQSALGHGSNQIDTIRMRTGAVTGTAYYDNFSYTAPAAGVPPMQDLWFWFLW